MLLFFRMCTKILFRFFATYWTHRLKINKFRHDRCVMLILIHISVDICPHLVASTAAVHKNLRGGLQTLKYCIYGGFRNRPVYDTSLLSWSWYNGLYNFTIYSMLNKNFWVLSSDDQFCATYAIHDVYTRIQPKQHNHLIHEHDYIPHTAIVNYVTWYNQKLRGYAV